MEEDRPEPRASDSDRGPVWDLILNVLQVIGAGAALVGWITVVGGANLWARFNAAGVPSPIRAVTVVPRESLFAEGLRTMAGPLALAMAGSVVVYLLLRRHARTREEAAATLELAYGDRYQAAVRGVGGPDDPRFDRYFQWRRQRDDGRIDRALATVSAPPADAAAPAPAAAPPPAAAPAPAAAPPPAAAPAPAAAPPPAAAPAPAPAAVVSPKRGRIRDWILARPPAATAESPKSWRHRMVDWWLAPLPVAGSRKRDRVTAPWRWLRGYPRMARRIYSAVLVALVVAVSAYVDSKSRHGFLASLLVVGVVPAVIVPVCAVATSSALWRRVRPYRWRVLAALFVVIIVIAGVGEVIKVAATVDRWLALGYAAAGLILLCVFTALARMSTPLRTAGTVFALLTLYLGVFGFLRELSDPTPALDPGQVLAKDPAEQIAGRYLARLDGDVYLATRGKTDEHFAITMVPKERVVAVFVGPSRDIPRTTTAKHRDAAPAKNEAELVKLEPRYPTPTPTATSAVTATPTQDKSTSSPQPGGDDAPEPLPDEPPAAAGEPPKVHITTFATKRLGVDGSFQFELPAYGQDVTGVASFDTRKRLAVDKTPDEPARTVRIQLATQAYESPKTAKRVLVRVRLSDVARRVIEREPSVEVVVTVVAVDDAGRAGRDDGCFFLVAHDAPEKLGTPKCD